MGKPNRSRDVESDLGIYAWTRVRFPPPPFVGDVGLNPAPDVSHRVSLMGVRSLDKIPTLNCVVWYDVGVPCRGIIPNGA